MKAADLHVCGVWTLFFSRFVFAHSVASLVQEFKKDPSSFVLDLSCKFNSLDLFNRMQGCRILHNRNLRIKLKKSNALDFALLGLKDEGHSKVTSTFRGHSIGYFCSFRNKKMALENVHTHTHHALLDPCLNMCLVF